MSKVDMPVPFGFDDYRAFVASKRLTAEPTGIEPPEFSKALFGFQSDIVKWALRRGRAAIFADCGMGKTASPVWMDIDPSDTLQHRSVREEADERHICPLQLEVIRRAIELWTNPRDLVLSPFAGIGSEGYEALRADRQFVGVELKKSYWAQAVANCKEAVGGGKQTSLFAGVGA